MNPFAEFAAIAAADGRAALVSVIEGGDTSAKLLVSADGETAGGLGDAELDRVAVEAAEELMWAERSELRPGGGAGGRGGGTPPAPRGVVLGGEG